MKLARQVIGPEIEIAIGELLQLTASGHLAWIIHELVRHPVDRHPLLNGRRVGWQQVVIARPW